MAYAHNTSIATKCENHNAANNKNGIESVNIMMYSVADHFLSLVSKCMQSSATIKMKNILS